MGSDARMSDEQSLRSQGIKWPKSKLPIYDLLIRYCLNVIEGAAAREIARQFDVEPSTITRQVKAITDLRDSSPFIDEELDKVQTAGDDQMNRLARVLLEYQTLKQKEETEQRLRAKTSITERRKKSIASILLKQPGRAKQALLNEADVLKLREIAAEIAWREPEDEALRPIRNRLGPELSHVLISACCTDKGFEQLEKEMKIPGRSAKVLLQVAIRQMQVFG